MALFSRRDMQAALNGLAERLTTKQFRVLVSRLNQNTPERLAAEWETVLMGALCVVGDFEYERQFGGTTQPDIFFSSRGNPTVAFVADIRTVSDANIEDENPVQFFWDEVSRVGRTLRLTGSGLYLDVKNEELGEFGDQKQRLLLPPKGQIPEFIRVYVKPFLTAIALNPDIANLWEHKQGGVHVVLRYNPNDRQFSGGGWIRYGVPYSARRNPLFKALNAKADQLRKCGWQGLRGIIICDGNCTALEDRSPSAGALGCRQIVEQFFREHRRTVSFVLVLEVKQEHRMIPRRHRLSVKPKLFWNPGHDSAYQTEIVSIFNQMLETIPRLARTPLNALHRMAGKNPGEGDSFYGGYNMTNDEIKISVRTLVELLAGKLNQQKFMEDHHFAPTKERPQTLSFFQRQIARGRTLQSVSLQKCEHEDDDWLVMKFGGPDPAVSEFRPPK
jgi:hypothetical protein